MNPQIEYCPTCGKAKRVTVTNYANGAATPNYVNSIFSSAQGAQPNIPYYRLSEAAAAAQPSSVVSSMDMCHCQG